MGMLSRYQKAGGFNQLLQLIETTGKQKQEHFLEIIGNEDSRWAEAIRQKMLTMEKIFSWDDQVLAEIAARLQELTIATALNGLKPEDGTRLLLTFTHSQRRNIEDLRHSKAAVPAEISSAFTKILVEVRAMITQGHLRMDKIDPLMTIPENFEDELKTGPKVFPGDELKFPSLDHVGGTTNGSNHSATPLAKSDENGHADSAELNVLRSKVNLLSSENNSLKSEVKILREKLAQIRKIA